MFEVPTCQNQEEITMKNSEKFAINALADALVHLCPVDTVAAVIDCALTAEVDGRLTDYEVRVTEALFEALCSRSPEAVDIAQRGINHSYASPAVCERAATGKRPVAMMDLYGRTVN